MGLALFADVGDKRLWTLIAGVLLTFVDNRWREPGTEDDWNAWLAWKRERDRLRRAL